MAASFLALVVATKTAHALERDAQGHGLSLALGVHDTIDQDPFTGVINLEYRPCCRWYTLRPAVGTLVTGNGAFYAYAGIRNELESSRRPFMLSINTAIGIYRQGPGTRLGHPLEFRSGFEAYYRLSNGDQIGTTFHHLSNASIGRRNPGTEILTFAYVVHWPRPGR